MELDINTIADWSEPKKVSTKAGPRILRTAAPNNKFSTLWSRNKPAMQKVGLTWSKDLQGNWQICWWQPDVEQIEKEETSISASQALDAKVKIPAPKGCVYLGYQKACISYAIGRTATYIADEMGLGKTVEALGIINADPSIKKVLVVCPASLKLNWAREANKWLVRKLGIGIVSGSNWVTANANFVIINYDIVTKHHARLHSLEWDLVIMDEVHYLKNPKAQRTSALLGNREGAPAIKAKRKVVMTGTPILNRPIEAYPVLSFIAPEEYGNFWKFARRYCNAYQGDYGWDFTGAANLEELQRRLRSTVMIRRMKADVLSELPPKRRQVIELPANGAEKFIEEEQRQFAQHANLESLRMAAEFAKLLEDQEAYAQAVKNLSKGQSEAFEDMARVRHSIALAKAPAVVEHVSNIEAPVVVFAHHRDVVEFLFQSLTETGKRCVKLIGGMSDEQKQASVDAFQNGKADVFIGNIRAAGVGITLTRSSHVVFAELDWVPAMMTQAEDRTHRIGQRESVLVQHIVLEGSLDQVMAKALVEKQEIADRALDNPIAKLEATEPVAAINVKDAKLETPEGEYSDKQIQDFLAKLRRLAGMCDGAQSLDDVGFNKFDTGFGKRLASLSSLSQKQAAAADILCRKYRRQLG